MGPLLDCVVIASGICYSLSVPAAYPVDPAALGATFFGQEAFHVVFKLAVIPLSVVALTRCRKHKNRVVGVLGFVGLALPIVAAVFGHDFLGNGRAFCHAAGALFRRGSLSELHTLPARRVCGID